MNKSSVNLQDTYLNGIRREKVPVVIFLINGVQLKGYIRAFDNFTVLLENAEGKEEMVYKHAISTVSPVRNVDVELPAEDAHL